MSAPFPKLHTHLEIQQNEPPWGKWKSNCLIKNIIHFKTKQFFYRKTIRFLKCSVFFITYSIWCPCTVRFSYVPCSVLVRCRLRAPFRFLIGGFEASVLQVGSPRSLEAWVGRRGSRSDKYYHACLAFLELHVFRLSAYRYEYLLQLYIIIILIHRTCICHHRRPRGCWPRGDHMFCCMFVAFVSPAGAQVEPTRFCGLRSVVCGLVCAGVLVWCFHSFRPCDRLRSNINNKSASRRLLV